MILAFAFVMLPDFCFICATKKFHFWFPALLPAANMKKCIAAAE